ncbi:MAG: hypothetical protein FJX76_10060 [Armatimonadetes bacterium]|nr:hypothetical protein [Armatimonadota bacterium]
MVDVQNALIAIRDRQNPFPPPVPPHPKGPATYEPRKGLGPKLKFIPWRPISFGGPQVVFGERSPVYAGFQCCIGRLIQPGKTPVPVFLDMRLGYDYVVYAQGRNGVRSQEIPVWVFWNSEGRMRFMKGAKFWVIYDDEGYLMGTNESRGRGRKDYLPGFSKVPDLIKGAINVSNEPGKFGNAPGPFQGNALAPEGKKLPPPYIPGTNIPQVEDPNALGPTLTPSNPPPPNP